MFVQVYSPLNLLVAIVCAFATDADHDQFATGADHDQFATGTDHDQLATGADHDQPSHLNPIIICMVNAYSQQFIN